MKRIIICFLSITLLLSSLSLSVSANEIGDGNTNSNEVPYRSYSYWVDYNTNEKTAVYSKPMYEAVKTVEISKKYDITNSKIVDISTNDDYVFLLDAGASKIVILNKNYEIVSVLENFSYNGSPVDFAGARGIFVRDNTIYVADTEHRRVLLMDTKGVIGNQLLLPKSNLIPTNFVYKPVKVAVDSKGYTYIVSDGSYYGAILYSPEYEFLGFFGANKVKTTAVGAIKNLWKKLTSNDTKRAADELSLPYTFTDIVIDNRDFVFTATGKSGKDLIQQGQISKINPGGMDILNKSDKNFADVNVGTLNRVAQIQDLSCITVDKDGFIYALDTTYGRIFWYDGECNNISVFAGSLGDGNQKGTFSLPSGIAVFGTDVLVVDAQKNSLTVFGMTKFGASVRKADKLTVNGDYKKSFPLWKSISRLDGNCQLAYRGLAKAYLEKEDYSSAMKYAKYGVDRETYAEAFKVVREQKLEKNFALIFIGVILIVALIVLVPLYLRKKQIVLIKNQKIKVALGGIAHPVESFRLVKEKGQGSVIIAAVLLVLLYVFTVLKDTVGGFAFTVFDTNNYNSFFVLLSTIGLVLLWTVSNWLVCTLFGGIGKIKEIFIITCYCTIPILISTVGYLALSHILVPDEGAFLSVFQTVCILYSAFMLIIGMMRIHDYEFGKFVWTTLLTVVVMIIIVFLIFLVFLLSQQVFGWIETIYIETIYR